jgi:hypothetical protein
MNALGQLAAIAFISLAGAGGTLWIKGPPVRKLACDPTTLKAHEVCLDQISPEAKVLWVDARLRRDWEKTGVPGSLLWNLDPAEDMQAFEADIAMHLMEAARVIVYCGTDPRLADRAGCFSAPWRLASLERGGAG